MSTSGQVNAHQLQQDIQHELITANQLLNQIAMEVKLIKNFTSPGGELESTIKNNASLMSTLAKLQHIDLDKVPPMIRTQINMNTLANQNETHHNTLGNESEMDDLSQIKS